jgi:hypothetical protein
MLKTIGGQEEMVELGGVERLVNFADVLVDDPAHITQYRAIGLTTGLQQGSEAEVLWAWQWLGDHPEFTNRLQEWFSRRVAELKEMGRIK